MIDRLVVSWGWESDITGKSQFLDYHQWQGTRDMTAFLTVPFAIQYLKSLDWPTLTQMSHHLMVEFQRDICNLLNIDPICTNSGLWQGQMCSLMLPDKAEPARIQTKLMENHHIEIPVFYWKDRAILRVSVQPYNTRAELDKLKDVLPGCLS